MKKLLFLVLVFGCFETGKSQNVKKFDLLKPDGEGYYSIPNNIGGKILLSDYLNYKNGKDSIFLEKIVYLKKIESNILMIADEFGSKSSIILYATKNDGKYRILYVEQNPYVDSIRRTKIKNHRFLILEFDYTGLCAEQNEISIYTYDSSNMYESFVGKTKQEFYYDKDPPPPCETGTSFTQKFSLKVENDKIVLVSNKRIEGKKTVSKTYYFKNHYFK